MPRKSKSKSSPQEAQPTLDVAAVVESDAGNVIQESVSAATPSSQRIVNNPGPYEDRRKAMQKQIQKMVTSMRNDGYSEDVIRTAVNREKRKEERKIIALEEKRANEMKACSNDVIIIPVAWKRDHNDKIQVDATCDNVRRALYSTGLNPWLDCRREYSPGQKFAYWEHMGVLHRIEIGPDDVKAGVCRIIRADKPGAYLEHQREKPELNLQAIIKTLKKLGLSKCLPMNHDLMSTASLVEPLLQSGQTDEFQQTLNPGEEDVFGNAVIPEMTTKNNFKKLRRF